VQWVKELALHGCSPHSLPVQGTSMCYEVAKKEK